jgi:magnesium chelatase family protein
LLDRLDIHVSLSPLPIEVLTRRVPQERSATVRRRVEAARARAFERNREAFGSGKLNARLSASELSKVAELTPSASRWLERAGRSLSLSARGYHKVLAVARTLADLEGSERVEDTWITEAVQGRFVAAPGSRRIRSGLG